MSILHLFVLLKITELTLGSWNDTFLNWERKNLKATVNPVKGQVPYLISWYHQSSGYHFSCGFYSYKQSCSQNFLWVCLHECALECSCLSTGPKWKIIPLKKHLCHWITQVGIALQYWMFDVSQTVFYQITLLRLPVCLSITTFSQDWIISFLWYCTWW